MFDKAKSEQAALALLDYIEGNKDRAYVLVDPLKYAAMSAAVQTVSSSEVIGQSKQVLGREVTPRQIKIMLADFDRAAQIALVHSDVENARSGEFRRSRTAADDAKVYIPIAYDKTTAPSLNNFRRLLNVFFSAQPVEEHEIRPERMTDTSSVIPITFEQLEYLREWANGRGEAKGWKAIKDKVVGRAAARLASDFSDVLVVPHHERRTDTGVVEPSADPENSTIKALVQTGKLVTAAALDERRQAKLVEKARGDGPPERS